MGEPTPGRPGARATDRRRTAPGWPTGGAGWPRSTPRSGRWRPPTPRSPSPTGAPSASCSTASTRSRRSRPDARATFEAQPLRPRPRPPLRTDPGARPAAGTGRLLASSSPTAATTHPSFSARRDDLDPIPERRAQPVGLLDGRLRGWPVHPVPRRDERHARPTARAATSSIRPRARIWAATRRPARSSSTSTSPSSRRAPSIHAGRARSRRRRTASRSRSAAGERSDH